MVSAPPFITHPRPRRILIVGAGPSGLVTLRNLTLPDAKTPQTSPFDEVLLVERKDEVGGVWYLDPKVVEEESRRKDGIAQGEWPVQLPVVDGEGEGGSAAPKPYWPSPAYPALRGNVLPRFLSFSCHPPFPPPSNNEPFPTLAETQDYLLSFAEPLRRNIRCNTEVVGVWELPAHVKEESGGGGWAVRMRDWSAKGKGKATTTHWDAVVLTNGWTDDPFYAPVPGIEEAVTAGKVHHAKWYRTPRTYTSRRVVVVGNGNSANDCVAHIAATRVVGKEEPVYRAVRHQILPYFSSLPDERIVDIPAIARYMIRPAQDGSSTLDLELEDSTVLMDVDFVIMAAGYQWGTYPFVRLLARDAAKTELEYIPDPVASPSAFAEWSPSATQLSALWHAVTSPAKQPDQPVVPKLPVNEIAPPPLEPAFPLRVPGLHRQILQARNPTLAFVGLVISHTPFQMADIASWYCRSFWDGSAGDVLPSTLEGREESDRRRVRELERRKAIVDEDNRTIGKEAKEVWYAASRRATEERRKWLAELRSSSDSDRSSELGAAHGVSTPHTDEGHVQADHLDSKIGSLALSAPGAADGVPTASEKPIPPPNPSLALAFHVLAFDEHEYAKGLRDDVVRAKPWLDAPVPPHPAPAPLASHTTSPEPLERADKGEQYLPRPLPRRDEEREAIRTGMYAVKKESLIKARARVREVVAAGTDTA